MRLWTIPKFPAYSITRRCEIYETKTQTLIHPLNPSDSLSRLVYKLKNLDGQEEEISVLRLMSYIAYGVNNLPIKIKDNSKIHDLFNVKVDQSKVIINSVTDDYMIICNDEYRRWKNELPYYVSRYGVVYTSKYNKFRRQGISYDGYYMLSHEVKGITNRINRIVYETWIGPITDKTLIVDHIDNYRWDNYYKNLQLITQKENVNRALCSDRWFGSIANSSVDEVKRVANMYVEGRSDDYIRKHTYLDNRQISEIKHKRAWKNILNDYDYADITYKMNTLTESDWVNIFNDINYLASLDIKRLSIIQYIANKYDVKLHVIRNGWKNDGRVQYGDIKKMYNLNITPYSNYDGSTTIESYISI